MRSLLQLSRISFLAGACILLFLLSFRTFMLEYRVAIFLNGSTKNYIASLGRSDIALPEPVSARNVRDFMSACGNSLTFAPQLKADPILAKKVSGNCKFMADQVLVLAPSNARSLAVRLLASDHIDRDTLALAQAAAPFEPWPLNIRLQAVATDPTPTPDVLKQAGVDVSRALMSPWGAAKVANLYRLKEKLRPTIASAVALASLENQAQFLNLMQREMRQAYR